jgi:hypothetical protein
MGKLFSENSLSYSLLSRTYFGRRIQKTTKICCSMPCKKLSIKIYPHIKKIEYGHISLFKKLIAKLIASKFNLSLSAQQHNPVQMAAC